MDKAIIETLKNNDRLKLKALYNEHRNAFFGFAKKYGLSETELADVYQEAFLALRKHAIKGTLDSVSTQCSTYLFGIGKFMIYDRLKDKKRSVSYEPKLHKVDAIEEIVVEASPSLTQEQQLLRTYFQKLGKKCQEVLTLFYYRGLTIDEIVEKSGYDNPNVVKAQKSRCLKTLKEMINS